ncbi:hypothetical protein [Schaalia hyovaginalis]|uniref:hypothetical protein n=1 Tax=Schaalia hyovaginalis TaxID=29316 RepID=UPI0026F20953|nr:hypothetical protein [Schaalia hyovaginalis]MCI6556886.1 hypothetical protein [Schaalia hyovaginalis]MDD7554429.1 hypothetical protein [Schaalia hyovaginalis]
MNDIPESAVAGEAVAQGSGRKRFNPATWTRRTKLIAGGAALALVLVGTGGGVAYHQYTIERDCQAQTELFGNQKTELTKAVKDAEAALTLVEGDTPADHTKGFATSDEGKTTLDALKKALAAADTHSMDAASQCSTSDDLDAIEALTSSRQTDLDKLTTQTKSFSAAVDAYRLKTASTEATSSMDTAKTDLAAAQKAATDQLAVVDGDTALQADTTVKAAYDALKKTENDSHSVSTTVTTSTYEEAVSSIEKAKTVAAKTGEVNTASQALKDAIKAYQDAKAAEAAAAQAAAQAQAQAAAQAASSNSYNSGYGSNGNWGSGSGNSNAGSTYTAPPANTASTPAPSTPTSIADIYGGEEAYQNYLRCKADPSRCQ